MTLTLIVPPRDPPRPPLPPPRPRPAAALPLPLPLPVPTTFTVTEPFFATSPRFFAWACCRLVCAAALRPAARFAVPAPLVLRVWAFAVARRAPAFFTTTLTCAAFFLVAALALVALNLNAPVFCEFLRVVPAFDFTTIFGLYTVCQHPQYSGTYRTEIWSPREDRHAHRHLHTAVKHAPRTQLSSFSCCRRGRAPCWLSPGELLAEFASSSLPPSPSPSLFSPPRL